MSFHDEDHCVAAISTALQQTAVRLTGHASPPHCGFPESPIAAAARTSAAEPLLSLHETAEFFAVLDSLIANASSEERARAILFDIDAALVPAVLQLFATDALAVPGGDLEPLLTAALATFRRIVTLPKMASVASADGAGASPDAGNVIPYVARVAIDMAMQAALPGRLAEILVAGHSVTVQLAASDLLFALALRSAAALRILATAPTPRSADGLPAPKPASVSALASGLGAQPAAPQSSVDSLLATIGQGDSTDPRVRAFAAATLREIATAHPEAVAASALSLARAVTLDAASDVRTLSAEALEITLSVDIALGARVVSACRRELCAALLHAVEKEPDPAALEAVLKLLAATLAVDATVAEQLQNATQSSFAELFVAGSGDGILVDTLRVGAKVASLAARALRLLIQHAPASRRVGHGLVAHERHTVTIIRALATATDFVNDAEAQRQANGGESVVDHLDLLAASICRVEIATAIALILAQDPIARRELRSYFTRYDDQKRQLGSSGGLASPGLADRSGLESGGASISSTERMHGLIMAALSTAALECFAGIAVMDVTGTWLNNPHKVQWQAPVDATPTSPEALRPTQDSVLALISAQEERAVAYLEAARDPTVPQAFSAPPEAAGPCDDEPTYRLTFVLLTLTVHTTFTADYEVPATKASGRAPATTDQTPQQSSQQHYARAVDFYKTIDPSAPPATEKTPVRAVRGDTTVVPPAALVAVDGESSEQRRRGAAEAQVVRDEMFTQFDQALSLATHFAVMFNAVGAPKPVVYETKGALVRRQPKQASWFAAPTPNSRSWGVDQLKQGDLFYFLLPTHSITAYALDQCRRMAARHAQYIKKSFVITPQAAKARRWFLFDMLNHIMPGISAALTELLDLCAAHGDEAVKFPMILFQQQELAAAEAAATAGGGQDYVSAAGVSDMVALHAGNLIATVEQVRFYFENNQHMAGGGGAAAFDATNAAAAAMNGARVGPATAGDQMTSQYLQDVERKIEALNRMEFTGGAGSKFFDPVRAIRETDAALSGQPVPQDTHWAE